MPRSPGQRQQDHDLLIEIKVRLGDLTKKVEEFTAIPKADAAQVIDHENRIRRLERWGLLAIGALGIVQFAIQYLR